MCVTVRHAFQSTCKNTQNRSFDAITPALSIELLFCVVFFLKMSVTFPCAPCAMTPAITLLVARLDPGISTGPGRACRSHRPFPQPFRFSAARCFRVMGSWSPGTLLPARTNVTCTQISRALGCQGLSSAGQTGIATHLNTHRTRLGRVRCRGYDQI